LGGAEVVVSKSEHRKKDKRDRGATEQAILDAFEQVLLRDGVKGLGINVVASQAGVNKVLIYRYFDDLPGLAKRWADTSDIWPPALELISHDPEAFARMDLSEKIITVLLNYMEGIRKRPLAVQILSAELCFPGEITRVLEAAIERPGTEVNEYIKLEDAGPEIMPKVNQLIAIVSALTAYMAIREINNPEWLGMHLGDETWSQLRSTIREIAEKYLAD